MKSIVRSRGFQQVVSSLAAAYLKLCYATMRWTRVEHERVQSVWARKGETGAILLFWHARIPISPPTWRPRDNGQTMHALISRSADGELIALTVEKIGFPAVRGSRQRKDSVGDKGGSEAFREMARWVRDRNAIAITPDGPAGPAQQMGDGAPSLARLTGAPVLMVGVACTPCIRFRSWDRTVLPVPFARGVMVWDGPFTVGRDADVAALAIDWTQRLTAVTDRAEAMVK